MGYFLHKLSRDIPQVGGLQLWPDGDGGLLLTWQRPIAPIDGLLVVHGPQPAALSELQRLPARTTRWPLSLQSGWIGVACLSGDQSGLPRCLCLDPALPTEPAPPAVPPPVLAQPGPPAPSLGEPDCAFCGAVLLTHDKLLRCVGCGRHFVIQPAGPPLDCATLDDGVCSCCSPRRPLQRTRNGLACPQSGLFYLHAAGGSAVAIRDLPFGVCSCCTPAQPLIRSGAAVVCLARPQQQYQQHGQRWLPFTSAPALLADAEAIDAALRANTALLGRNGLFVF